MVASGWLCVVLVHGFLEKTHQETESADEAPLRVAVWLVACVSVVSHQDEEVPCPMHQNYARSQKNDEGKCSVRLVMQNVCCEAKNCFLLAAAGAILDENDRPFEGVDGYDISTWKADCTRYADLCQYCPGLRCPRCRWATSRSCYGVARAAMPGTVMQKSACHVAALSVQQGLRRLTWGRRSLCQ